jgi:tetratricopeptide (TPR) repeat protein
MLKSYRAPFVPLLLAASLSLGACASLAPASPALRGSQSAATASDRPASVYGEFLAGSTALSQGHGEEASAFFARGAASGPEAVLLKERAFTAALVAGDVHHAALLAPAPDEGSVATQRLGRLARAIDALADKRPKEAEALLAEPQIGPPHRAAALLLLPWAAAAAGDWKTALTLPDAQGDRLVDGVSRLDLALLLERDRHYDLADAAYRKLLNDGDGSGLFTAAYGEFLERRNRRPDATALYEAALKGDPSNTSLRKARDRSAAGQPAPLAPTFTEGAAQALLAPAAVFLSEKQQSLGLVYLRLVLWLDPGRNEAWLMVGDTLAAAGDREAARLAYVRPLPGTPEFVSARARLIATYDQPADNDKALALAEETAKAAPDDVDALTLLADALRTSERYAESAAVMDTVIARQGDKATWQSYYLRGASLAQADQWPAAERDLLKALALQPDEPDVLNFLGYSWIDRGVRLSEAKAMIEKAVAATPDSGAIVDSLGWAYYRLGDYPRAVEQLEHAVELDAGDPDINDHLGDAYWKVGRRIEARFQWEAVLTMEPSAKLRAQVEQKLKTNPADDHGRADDPKVALR